MVFDFSHQRSFLYHYSYNPSPPTVLRRYSQLSVAAGRHPPSRLSPNIVVFMVLLWVVVVVTVVVIVMVVVTVVVVAMVVVAANVTYASNLTILAKLSAFRDAPPTRVPSMSGSRMRSSMLSGLTLPP